MALPQNAIKAQNVIKHFYYIYNLKNVCFYNYL